MGIMRRKRCADCRTPLPAGSPSDRCGECQELYLAELADLQDERAPRDNRDDRDHEVVDYSRGGAARPNLNPPRPGQHWTHDSATRVQMLHAMNSAGGEDSMMTSWDQLVNQQPDRRVAFHRPGLSPAPDPLGRSVPRDRGLYSREERGYEIPSGSIVRSSGAGERAVAAQQQDRFGGRVSMPPPLRSGHFASAPHLEARESAQREYARAADAHTRSQAPSWRR